MTSYPQPHLTPPGVLNYLLFLKHALMSCFDMFLDTQDATTESVKLVGRTFQREKILHDTKDNMQGTLVDQGSEFSLDSSPH